MNEVRDLVIALEAALRWQYGRDTLEHIKHGVPKGKNFDPGYIDDVRTMRHGVKIAEEQLGIDIIAVIQNTAPQKTETGTEQ